MSYSEKYGYSVNIAEIERSLEAISRNISSIKSKEVLLKCFSMMDLTTLKNDDTPSSVSRFTAKVAAYREAYPDYPLPASICVYPNFAAQVARERLCPELHVTSVSSCFPTTQSFLEVKLLECRMAAQAGADEIDVVLPLASFMDGDLGKTFDDLKAMRDEIDRAGGGRRIIMKVILETGILSEPAKIAEASFLAMEAGADFIKTSTGKVSVNATPVAAYIMCQCIALYYEKTGRMVGFKPAGGIATADDAICYYSIVSTVLGKEWLDKEHFRFGVSRMANNLLSAIEEETVAFF
ncbi:MAG: deoxyribose-phosphate aldolase [Bacteroidales bacterium]|nr:deoxyribose-phosphate aldolase [Bacteroidales bacterium]